MMFLRNLPALLCLLLLTACADRLAGPSETTNGIVLSFSGLRLSAKSATPKSIHIYDTDYHPIYGTGIADSLEVATSVETQHSLVNSGTYNIFVYSEALDSGLFIPALAVHPDSTYHFAANLSGVGLVRGQASTPMFGAAVFIPGSGLGSWLDQQGGFEIRSVPPGDYTLTGEKIIRLVEGPDFPNINQAVTLIEGDTLTVNF